MEGLSDELSVVSGDGRESLGVVSGVDIFVLLGQRRFEKVSSMSPPVSMPKPKAHPWEGPTVQSK